MSASTHDEMLQRVCARIAPTWPLDRFIAVNPFWGLIDKPLSDVAAKLQSLSGAQLLMPRAWYRNAYREGLLRDEHLEAACSASASTTSLASLRALLEQDEPSCAPRTSLVDIVDGGRDLKHALPWRTFVTHSVSQFCASYFDDGQAQLKPNRDQSLYASWRAHALVDRSPALMMGADSFRTFASTLPETATALIEGALDALEVPPSEHEDYLWSLLLDQNGWAAWCAYRRWTARLAGGDDDAIVDLLAVRLAWDWILHRMGGEATARRWQSVRASWSNVDRAASAHRAQDWLLQVAMEHAFRAPVIRALPAGLRATRNALPSVQAVFCIDVRSEVFRRAFEGTSPSVQTLGFAGFFGIPMDYQPLGATSAQPQLPGLLAPRLRAADTGLEASAREARASHFEQTKTWSAFKTDALSSFTFVEAIGLTYLGKLLQDGFGFRTSQSVERNGLAHEADRRRKPRLVGTVTDGALDLDAQTSLAAGMLRGMSLTRDFARVVLLTGHGSSTCNNPHAAGLDCGACCGQTGEANARVAAALLNAPEVRARLVAQRIVIPDTTRFVPALHNTTTDEVELFDLDDVPPSHAPDIEVLRVQLADAGARTRSERARRMGLAEESALSLKRILQARTGDWAEVRPEWGLANNAAFIVAPREHCKHLNLEGRAFLHEYRHQEDESYAVLESIMTAPMIVTHWINFQYYASTVDNARYGSGNKVLHNVVGGHLGVFEGNGGDLRIGLPMQSLHDGQAWVHTPLRLSVFIEAPKAAIDNVIQKHAHVRALVTQGWLNLFQIDDVASAVYALRGEAWHRA